jgi:hypothetical protein
MKRDKSKLLKIILPYLKNKYFLTFMGFVLWLGFFDRNDFITTWNYRKKLEGLRNEKKYFEEAVKKNTEDLNYLLSDPSNTEKYGRERYYMKRENEEIFVIIDERKKEN